MRNSGKSMRQAFIVTAIVASAVQAAAPTSAFGQAARSIGERYASREPRTCADTRAPARGAITAALALRYLNCQMDYESSDLLYLVQNVTVQVGGPVSYAAIRGQRSWSDIDTRTPVYPIRGGLLRYQCAPAFTPGEPNCRTYNEPRATGHCYKTTFGDWKCYMSDPAGMNTDGMPKKVAAPKSN